MLTSRLPTKESEAAEAAADQAYLRDRQVTLGVKHSQSELSRLIGIDSLSNVIIVWRLSETCRLLGSVQDILALRVLNINVYIIY